MRLAVIAAAVLGFIGGAFAADAKPLVTGLKNPRAVAVGPDRRVYVTVCEDPEKAGTGAVMAIENGKVVPFASSLDVPSYLVAWQNWLLILDKECIWRIDRKGKAERFVRLADFPEKVDELSGICVDERGMIYVTTEHDEGAGDRPSIRAGLFRINQRGKTESVLDNADRPSQLFGSAILMDGMSHLLVFSGSLHRFNLEDRSIELVAKDNSPRTPRFLLPAYGPRFGGIAWDHHGRLYLSRRGGNVEVIGRPGDSPVQVASGFSLPGGPCISPDGKAILVPDVKAGTVTAIPTGDPTRPVDESPLPLATEIAFPDLQWAGWTGETPAGKPNPLRPLVLTHANDQSGRNFVATQHGVIHVFPNNQAAKKTKVFLDISERVRYDDKSNEEGFLGLAFHPDYKRTGEFFAFYTERTPGHSNVLSRFRVSKDNPDKADPASEEVLLRVQHKYWNHDGGTVIFGPDGYLYLALGDGGAANDPDRNGPNLNTLLGKIIRIDVNRRDGDKPYGIPKDNPFVGRGDARPEVYAYGLRNVWRMAFDRPTGRLWAADVGQNIYEEINLIEKGGNYGWSYREGLHPFSAKGVGPRPDLIEPIWEYDHEVGKSITGGAVYRGLQFPELAGMYLYADYVSGKIWGLRYDEKQKRVVANRPIREPNVPIMSFGEDDRGELYFMTYSPSGRDIYRFVRDQGTKIGKGNP
jgi:glucose/arabinose dehydrogenase/sugar lactone lactonase YvrE